MKIAFIVTGGLHPSGRLEVVPLFLDLLGTLARSHEVHAFVVRHLPEPTSYALRGIHVHDLGRPGNGHWYGRLAQWQALSCAMRAHGPFDVVHGWWIDPAGFLAALAGRRFGIPSVVTCDSGEFVSLPAINYGLQRTLKGRALVRAACRLAARVHVTTHFMERLAQAHGLSPVRIPIGVDLSLFSSSTRPPEGPPWRLIQVASLNRVKDQHTLFDALAILRQTHDVRLDLVGEDTLDGDLHSYTNSLGLDAQVTFHGYVPHDELPQLLSNAHLYVQSSLHEAAGVAVLEAAAAGLPVVGTSVGYVDDWSPGGAAAVPVRNARAFADAIASLLTDAGQRRQLATQATALARISDLAASVASLDRLYFDLASRRSRRND